MLINIRLRLSRADKVTRMSKKFGELCVIY